jgi:hypothetical protein
MKEHRSATCAATLISDEKAIDPQMDSAVTATSLSRWTAKSADRISNIGAVAKRFRCRNPFVDFYITQSPSSTQFWPLGIVCILPRGTLVGQVSLRCIWHGYTDGYLCSVAVQEIAHNRACTASSSSFHVARQSPTAHAHATDRRNMVLGAGQRNHVIDRYSQILKQHR